jgi:hypothetical protein
LVSRHLKRYPQFDLVCCDIHANAIEFLKDQIGVKTLLSASVPEEFSALERYDVVFALSFFSHMPKSTFGRWLLALYSALKTPGYLVFTTHGLACVMDAGIAEMPPDGFFFAPVSEQKDLDTSEYGCAVVTPGFVMGELCSTCAVDTVIYRYADWWKKQDLWIARRPTQV